MVSIPINNRDSPIEMLEKNLRALNARMPDVPFNEILLCRLLLQIGRAMGAMLEQHIRPSGLAEVEFRVLTTLFSQPDGVAHPSDLCARTAQSPATMSRISDVLVSRNLITRVLSDEDRRRMVLRINDQGEELVRQLLPAMFAPLRALYAEFPDSAQCQLIAQLKRLYAGLADPHKQQPSEQVP